MKITAEMEAGMMNDEWCFFNQLCQAYTVSTP